MKRSQFLLSPPISFFQPNWKLVSDGKENWWTLKITTKSWNKDGRSLKNEQWNEFWSTRGGRKSVRSWSSATKTPSCVKPWRAMSSPAGSSSTPSSHNAITVTGNGSGSTTPRNRLSPAPINIIVNNVTTGVQVGEAANARWRQRTLTSSSAASSQRPATFQTRVTSLGSNPCIF